MENNYVVYWAYKNEKKTDPIYLAIVHARFGLLAWITCSEHGNMENIYLMLCIHVDSIGRGAHSGTEYEARMAESIGHNYILWIWSRVELVRFSFTLDGWTRNVCLLVENGKWKLKIEVCWLIGWAI